MSSVGESKRPRATVVSGGAPSGLGPGSSPVRRKPAVTRATAASVVDGDALLGNITTSTASTNSSSSSGGGGGSGSKNGNDPASAAIAAQARRRQMAAVSGNDDNKRRTQPSSLSTNNGGAAVSSMSSTIGAASNGDGDNMDDVDDDGNPIVPVKLTKKEKLALEKERLASEAEQRRAAYNRMVGLWKDRGARKRAPRTAGGPIRFRTNFRNTILDVFKERGWKETDRYHRTMI